jgi:hypothetical protein
MTDDQKLKWYQFSLGGMLKFIAIFAAILGGITSLGFDLLPGFFNLLFSFIPLVFYLALMRPLFRLFQRFPNPFYFLSVLCLYFILVLTFSLVGSAIDSPLFSIYDCFNWVSRNQTLLPAQGIFCLMLLLIPLDIVIQKIRSGGNISFSEMDRIYGPTIGIFPALKNYAGARMVAIVGGLFLMAYYASTVIELHSIEQHSGGLILPPDRIFSTLTIAWGVLWIAECQSRPRKGTISAALFFTMVCILLLLSSGGFVRE